MKDCLGFMVSLSLLFSPLLSIEMDQADPQKVISKNEILNQTSLAEDLLREHGVLNRLLLIYENIDFRLTNGLEVPPGLLIRAAGLIRRFVEDYHAKLEEDYIFVEFEKKKVLMDLVAVLKEQHQRGRLLTDYILTHATPHNLKNEEQRQLIGKILREFIDMSRPHEAREDTVLFPAFRELITTEQYALLGRQFEKKEQELFGNGGFKRVVDEVVAIEKALGIYDLSQYTPALSH